MGPSLLNFWNFSLFLADLFRYSSLVFECTNSRVHFAVVHIALHKLVLMLLIEMNATALLMLLLL
jgi:hypothetical protein